MRRASLHHTIIVVFIGFTSFAFFVVADVSIAATVELQTRGLFRAIEHRSVAMETVSFYSRLAMCEWDAARRLALVNEVARIAGVANTSLLVPPLKVAAVTRTVDFSDTGGGAHRLE
eukprot:gene5334-24631_t